MLAVSRTGDGWVVKAGSDSLRIVGSPRDKGFGAMVVVSNTADALVVDAGEAFAKGAECILMYSSAIDLKPIDGRDVMVRSVWSGSRGTKCGVLLEGSDRNGKHWWRSGRVTPTERPRTFRHAHKVDEGMRGLHYRLDLSLAKGPILFHKLEIGPYSELAPSSPPRARPELIFHAPFDGDARAAFAKGDPAPCKASGLEYAKGRRGKAVRLSSALKSALAYNLKGNLNPACGTIAFWFRHEWKETKRLGYRDDNGKDIWRYILSAPAESRHLGDGCLGLWWWRDAVRMDRGDLDHRYGYFWYSKPGDAWRHYVVVWDDYGTRLYCDGRLAGTSDSWSPMKEALDEADPLEFDREGLRIVPTVNQQTVPIEEGVVTRAAMTDGSLHPTTISIHDTGKPNWGGWHSTPPNFCIYHPDVQREFLRIFDALIADGAGHPSFSGICLHLTSITCPWWGSIASGYNDYCIDAFEKATRVKVPVDRKDPLRGKAYAEWLKANAYEKWVQWRCDVLCDFYVKLAKRLAAARPDLRLWVNAMPSSRPSDPDYAQDGYREKCMREAGIDAAQLVRRIPNLVMGTTLSPCGFRHVGMRTPGTPELLEKVRTYPDAPGYYSVFRPAPFTWLNLHDNYWESPIGAGKTGNLLTCDWLQEATWRVTALQANGRNTMKYYAVPFLHNDIQMISCGGFLEGSYGMEEMMARFAQYFRALPAVKFPTVAKNGNVVLRGGEAEGKSWFYIVNADERPARVEISVPARTVDLATRVRLGSDAGARRVALDLEPYEFRSFAAPSGRPVLH